MKKAVIVSKYAGNINVLNELLVSEGFETVMNAQESDEACKLINSEKPEFILINTPIADASGLELAVNCSKATSACIVLMVKSDKADEISRQMLKYGIMVIAKPLSKHLFHHYILFEECFRRRMDRVNHENKELRTQVEIMKIVNRAKMLLMQHLRMTETQAHHYLERQAMDLRKSKYDIALNVLKTYEN